MYIDLDVIKNQLNIDKQFTADDALLVHYEEAAEKVVEKNLDQSLESFEDIDGQIPEPIIQAMLLMITNWYENRSSVAYAAAMELPQSYNYLIDLYKNYNNKENL